MNKYKRLISNSFILLLGNLGSKLIVFFLVPLYTRVLTTEQYGLVDIIITSINLLIPFISLELGQAALRFSIENTDYSGRKKIFNNLLIHCIVVALLLFIAYPILYKVGLFSGYLILFLVLLYFQVVNNIYSQYLRGIDKVKEFAINGILTTVMTVIFNLILLVYFNRNVDGYLLSMILATLISNIYIFVILKAHKRIELNKFDIELQKEMLKFSIPLIPNTAMWWLINGASRYIILFLLGPEANGLYAVASKVPGILSLVNTIFLQAWQISSFEEYDSTDRDSFYSKIYNLYSAVILSVATIIVIYAKPIFTSFIGSDFVNSWIIVPPLLLGVAFQSMSSFLGTNYTASKKTKGAFTTSIYAGIASVIANFLSIKLFGFHGAGLGNLIGFFVMWIVRYFDTKKYVSIKVDYINFILNLLVYILGWFGSLYLEFNHALIVNILLTLSLIVINFKYLKDLINMLKSFLIR